MGGKGSSQKKKRGTRSPPPEASEVDLTSAPASPPPTTPMTGEADHNPVAPSEAVTNFDTALAGPSHAPAKLSNYTTHSATELQEYGRSSDAGSKREPPPKREVEQHHHRHHVINVDSDTDFDKMTIHEHKVNYLPYNPPVAVSQTGLIQSIGKPFSRNHAKHLPDPGDEFKLTRRVSQVKLYQIALLGDVNASAISKIAKTLHLLSILIGVAGFAFFCFMLSVAAISTPMEYSVYFLDSKPMCKAIHIAGAVQPFAVAPYCHYAMINLKYIRTYFLRVPISLLIPTGVILCALSQLSGTVADGDMQGFLFHLIEQYPRENYASRNAKETWDGIQDKYRCCGYDTHRDWQVAFTSGYPDTCCKDGLPGCTDKSDNLKDKACKEKYIAANLWIVLMYCVLGGAIIGLEVVSVLLMKSLHALIGKELYDERSSLSITCGKMCSMCDIEDTDEEIEYDGIVGNHDHRRDSLEKRPYKKASISKEASSKKVPVANNTKKSGLGLFSKTNLNKVAPKK